MRRANIDQARLFAAGDDLDRKSERRLGQRQELAGIFRHAQGIGCHRPHRALVEAGQPLTKTAQSIQRPFLRIRIEALVCRQTGGQTHRLLQRVQGINLVVDHAPDLQAKAVGAEVDGSYGFINHGLEFKRRKGLEPILASTPATDYYGMGAKKPASLHGRAGCQKLLAKSGA